MTPFHEYFIPIFLLGCLIAVVASFFAARLSGCVWPGLLLIAGVKAFWSGLFIGMAFGYTAWQSMPDPPDEAFSDASALGALLFGWFPACCFCLVVFGTTRGAKWLIRRNETIVYDEAREPSSKRIETGNQYQSPTSG